MLRSFGTLENGLQPLVLRYASASKPCGVVSVPSVVEESRHLPCKVSEPELDLGDVCLSTEMDHIRLFLEAEFVLWQRNAKTYEFEWNFPYSGRGSTEQDVCSAVNSLLDSIIRGLRKMFPDADIQVQVGRSFSGSSSARFWSVLKNGRLIGCVEVKKP